MAIQGSDSRKRAKAGVKVGTGVFDKTAAVRMVEVPVVGPGVYSFEEDVTSAERVWVEWHPSAAITGKARRAFLGKSGVADPSAILTDRGRQMPRKGLSCSMEDRRVIVFGPGKFKIWVASERRNNSSTAARGSLPSDLLQLVAPGTGSIPPRQGTPMPVAPARR